VPSDPTPSAAEPAPSAAFAALLAVLRADAVASGADFERIASYCRVIERLAERYAAGLPQKEPRKAAGG
jgi:hypothetical protein